MEKDKSVEGFVHGNYDTCFMCTGFYGLNFNQPLCSTCHMFLYPSNINWLEEAACTEKTDSGDSGNEEPNVETDFYSKMEDSFSVQSVAVVQHMQPILPAVHKPDRLAERINSLSHAQDYRLEKIPDGLIDSLPTEVLLAVFHYLDDISLWQATKVCVRWRNILNAELYEDQWKQFIDRRWPLFQPQYSGTCWKIIYSKMLQSCCCVLCLDTMMLQHSGPIIESSWRHRRLRSELKALRADPLEGIQAMPLDRHCSHWQACITGPRGSPYEGGLFFLYLQIPHSYPMQPPVVRFVTKVFHPNISRHGDVGLDSIHHNWSLALTISKVLLSIQSLLTDPYWYVCMEPTIGQMYRDNVSEFNRIARLWTWKYAMHDYLKPFSESIIPETCTL